MKKTLIAVTGLVLALAGQSQTVKGSIQQGSAPNKVNIVYLPDHNTIAGEYVNYLSVSIAIPTSLSTGVTPSIVPAGIFSPTISFTPAVPFSYILGTETIYSWICSNNTNFTMAWSLGVAFVGATITLDGGGPGAVSKIKLVDFSNLSGGANGNSFFNVGVNVPPFDLTDYADFFHTLNGANGSLEGDYPSGDKFVETNMLISLPVHLLNFSGYKMGAKNILKWTVASEVNNRGFDVQRSVDGINYVSIGFVNSQASGGYSNTQLSYTFDDLNPVGKKQYYRLNQVDIDGQAKLSNVVMITGGKPTTIGIGGLFPNPARSLVNVIIDAPGRENVTLIVMDVNGKTVKQQTANVEIGSNTIPVEISDLASGSYLVKVICKTDCETAVAKFNKQ